MKLKLIKPIAIALAAVVLLQPRPYVETGRGKQAGWADALRPVANSEKRLKKAKDHVLALDDIRPDADEWGEKLSNLARMRKAGLSVPDGFGIGVKNFERLCTNKGKMPRALRRQITSHVRALGRRIGRTFGDSDRPLVLIARPSAKEPLPGFMPSVIIGINNEIVKVLAREISEPAAYIMYLHSIWHFGVDILGIDAAAFPALPDGPCPAERSKRLIAECRRVIRLKKHRSFPQDPWRQLEEVISGVARSWDNEDIKGYRRRMALDLKGTAIAVQEMIFVDPANSSSGAGFLSTRDIQTGLGPSGWFLRGGIGEDLMKKNVERAPTNKAFRILQTGSHRREIEQLRDVLEGLFREPVVAEFIIGHTGRLWLVQTSRAEFGQEARLTALANMFVEGLISEGEFDAMVRSVPAQRFNVPSHVLGRRIGQGEPVGEGAAWGEIVFVNDTSVMAKESFGRRKSKPFRIQGIIAVVPQMDDNVQMAVINRQVQGLVIRSPRLAIHYDTTLRLLKVPAIVGADIKRLHWRKYGVLKIDHSKNKGALYAVNERRWEEPIVRPLFKYMMPTIRKGSLFVEYEMRMEKVSKAGKVFELPKSRTVGRQRWEYDWTEMTVTEYWIHHDRAVVEQTRQIEPRDLMDIFSEEFLSGVRCKIEWKVGVDNRGLAASLDACLALVSMKASHGYRPIESICPRRPARDDLMDSIRAAECLSILSEAGLLDKKGKGKGSRFRIARGITPEQLEIARGYLNALYAASEEDGGADIMYGKREADSQRRELLAALNGIVSGVYPSAEKIAMDFADKGDSGYFKRLRAVCNETDARIIHGANEIIIPEGFLKGARQRTAYSRAPDIEVMSNWHLGDTFPRPLENQKKQRMVLLGPAELREVYAQLNLLQTDMDKFTKDRSECRFMVLENYHPLYAQAAVGFARALLCRDENAMRKFYPLLMHQELTEERLKQLAAEKVVFFILPVIEQDLIQPHGLDVTLPGPRPDQSLTQI